VSFVQPDPTNPARQIVYISLEGPEAGTYFRGTAKLTNGQAVIQPPEHWRMVTSASGITVQVTPRGNCQGLYVAEASRSKIIVRESNGGASNVQFDYFVNGVRDGFENHQVYQPNSMFLPTGETWNQDANTGVARALHQNGILLPGGKVNKELVDRVRTETAGLIDKAAIGNTKAPTARPGGRTP
jgi:hypothetical protein